MFLLIFGLEFEILVTLQDFLHLSFKEKLSSLRVRAKRKRYLLLDERAILFLDFIVLQSRPLKLLRFLLDRGAGWGTHESPSLSNPLLRLMEGMSSICRLFEIVPDPVSVLVLEIKDPLLCPDRHWPLSTLLPRLG